MDVSRSRNKDKTWNQLVPGIPYCGASYPKLLSTSDNMLILAVRMWRLFNRVNNGHSWGLANVHRWLYRTEWTSRLPKMSDGRILVVNDDDEQVVLAQFVTLDVQVDMHPALPGTAESEQKQP